MSKDTFAAVPYLMIEKKAVFVNVFLYFYHTSIAQSKVSAIIAHTGLSFSPGLCTML